MDVSQEILNNHLVYGASDNTAPQGLAASKSLNYAKGSTIQKPVREMVSLIPRRLKYADTVGLFGAENVFIKVELNIIDTGNGCIEETNWECLYMNDADFPTVNTYVQAKEDLSKDTITVNTYEPAEIINRLPDLYSPHVSVSLANLKTGNKYIDAWFDVRLYTKAKEEHPYDEMYLPITDYFYIGFHARNTKRLPYNVECLIGSRFISKEDVDPKLLPRVN